ncbi:MAG: hypothetical protein D6736_06795 [Nitrospinota bacterium]|nr:MAG: hypothetical protein D6736_06795 [Nitrospinota bacterium]
MLLVLPLRLYLYQRRRQQYQDPVRLEASHFLAFPLGEFGSDLLLWLSVGVGVSLFHKFFYGFPLLYSGTKLVTGCLVVGVLAGMLSFLEMEREGFLYLQQHPVTPRISSQRIISVSHKMFFLVTSVLVFVGVIILLMVLKDMQFLLDNRALLTYSHIRGIVLEILFVLLTILAAGLVIIYRFSQNMKALFSLELEVLDEVRGGEYTKQVPVVTNDEFGIIADQTNRMIAGLRERDFIRETFGKYVSPEVSEAILSGRVPLDGELREVTILFSDLRGFTPFAEARHPKEVVQILNRYFSEMGQAITGQEGLILQFVGDGIEAVFGAPVYYPDHPQKAVQAALEMRERLRCLNERGEEEGKPPLAHGIGIHTGMVMAGTIGSGDRLSYALVGDTVNFAARIEQLTKTFQWDILLSQATVERLGDAFVVEQLPPVTVKGKTGEQILFKLLGVKSAVMSDE